MKIAISTAFDNWRAERSRARWRALADRARAFCQPLAPALMAAAVLAGLFLMLVACGGGGSPGAGADHDRAELHEDVRAGCATAARAYRLAVDRTSAGDMSIETFRSVDAGYTEVMALCRQVLIDDAPPTPADLARLADWTAGTENLAESAVNSKGAPQ